MDTILNLLNFWPGGKRKAAAGAALFLAVIAAWNTAMPDLGLGPCTPTPDMIAHGLKCIATDLTIHVPTLVNSLLMALIAVGAAAGQKNDAAAMADRIEQKTGVRP